MFRYPMRLPSYFSFLFSSLAAAPSLFCDSAAGCSEWASEVVWATTHGKDCESGTARRQAIRRRLRPHFCSGVTGTTERNRMGHHGRELYNGSARVGQGNNLRRESLKPSAKTLLYP